MKYFKRKYEAKNMGFPKGWVGLNQRAFHYFQNNKGGGGGGGGQPWICHLSIRNIPKGLFN